ncbi:PREDICTED: probable low affinity copper uptake protein 2 isoform X2 [Polistes canadensis]|uniref:probable low affinity copper uptake protein 2 isoform X2 n=1 Tax=Polistes canadensis TaxID=91411 RepID=UPI000718F33D|nr:PREDICTED: probable low affinity copper uptake protein 2 isoform X2 [Polistes canadensis]
MNSIIIMHRWYWFGEDLGTFLFPGYNISTASTFISTCIGLISLAILYEAMKISRIKLEQIAIFKSNSISRSSENSSLLSEMSPRSFASFSSRNCANCSEWMLQVLHWSIHTTLGYMLMMAVMTYNVYISIVLVIGSCLGYWIFGPVLIELNMRRFQERQKIIKCDKKCTDNTHNQERRESAVSVIAEQLVLEATVEIHMQ